VISHSGVRSISIARMRTLGVLVSMLTSGCSFMFVNGAPSNHANLSDFDCVADHGAPAADVTGTVVTGILAAGLAAVDDDPSDPDGGEVGIGFPIAFGALAVLHLSSAVYGFANVRSCDDAKKQLAIRRDAQNKAQLQRIKQLEEQIAAGSGCGSDKECKADRICIDARCVSPPTPASTPEPAAAAPEPVTPAPVTPEPAAPGP
jgi:hypothetical protein